MRTNASTGPCGTAQGKASQEREPFRGVSRRGVTTPQAAAGTASSTPASRHGRGPAGPHTARPPSRAAPRPPQPGAHGGAARDVTAGTGRRPERRYLPSLHFLRPVSSAAAAAPEDFLFFFTGIVLPRGAAAPLPGPAAEAPPGSLPLAAAASRDRR